MSKNCKLSGKILFVFPVLLALAVLTFFTMVAAKSYARELPPQILINGQEVPFPDAQPFLDEKGRVQAPARFVAQGLGAAVTWEDSSSTAYISGHGKSIALTPGQDTAEVNGLLVSLDSGAVLEQDRIFVPLRFIAETLGATVQWDEPNWTVAVSMELPIIRDSGISYTKQEAGWYSIPSTFTAWVEADNAHKVDFYLTPTGTNQEPVKIATAYSNNQKFSLTYTMPGGYTMAHFWAVAVNDSGEESTGIFNVYCRPDSGLADRTIGFGDRLFTGYNNDIILTADGNKAVFSTYYYPPGEGVVESSLLLLDLLTENITTLDQGSTIRALGWDPAGENVLYVKDSNLTRFSLQDGSKNTIAQETYYGSYSPDGSMIAYARGKSGLWVSDSNGGSQKRLTQTNEDWFPVWYPDGQHLFYFNDLGQELGDGAGRLQGMAKISVADGSMEQLFPEKTGKFRSAGWIVPGGSLHVVSGWDDVYYHHILDLNGRKITDLGENNYEYARGGYITAVLNQPHAGEGWLCKATQGGLIEIYDGTGVLQKHFDLGQDDRVYTKAAYSLYGRVLLLHYLPTSGDTQVQKTIEILDPATGISTVVTKGRDNYEACFWGREGQEVWVLENDVQDARYVLSGFNVAPVGEAE